MADEIRKPDADKGEGNVVTSVTETVPHPADADSSPGPYEGLSPDRPPVSTTQADVPIAQSLVAGAGAPQPYEGTPPEEQHHEDKPLTKEQKAQADK